MCGRICSVLALFIPYSNYNFENVLTYLNAIYDGITTDLGEQCMFNNNYFLLIIFIVNVVL